MGTVIAWKGTHNEDWKAWAVFHREVSAYERARGNAGLSASHEQIACKYDRRDARAAKRQAKAARL